MEGQLCGHWGLIGPISFQSGDPGLSGGVEEIENANHLGTQKASLQIRHEST